MNLTRRQFIRNVSVAGGALTLGFQLTGCSEEPLLLGSETDFRPNAFLRIDTDGTVTLQIPKAEMGQGIVTGMVTLVAEELELDPAAIRYEMAPVHSAFADPEMRLQITGGSASIRVYYDILRQVGASARETLVVAAMNQTGLARDALQASNGIVISSNRGGVRIPYGELVPEARTLPAVTGVMLKPASELKLIGRYEQRVDAEVKSNGTAQFGIDIAPEGCLTAVLLRCPWFDGAVESFDAAAASGMPGVAGVFATEHGVAVVADGYWPARQAAAKVNVRFTPPLDGMRDSAAITAAMAAALDGDDFASVRDEPGTGPEDGTLVQARYEVPFLAHAPMEPLNATCRLTAGGCEVWVGTQAPDVARDAASRVLGVPREAVVIHNQFLGGGFGRRAAADNVAEVVAIARELERPVKLVWSREDDIRHDWYRPAMAGQIQARVGAGGDVSHWRHRIVGPSINQQVLPKLAGTMLPQWVPAGATALAGKLAAGKDFASVEGAKELPYNFAGINVEYHNLPVPVPLGYWRSVGHSHTAFVVESFVDELAHSAGLCPLAFRLRYLAEDSRERRVLDAVAEAANWGKAAPGRFQGLAVHASFHSVVAEVVEISLEDGKPRLEHVYCAVDCGQVINPDIVRDQMIGGIVFALSAALYGEITLKDGAVEQGNYHDYPVLRQNEVPPMTVVLLDSDAPPTGVGEPGTPPAAPALANALFAATGVRQRRLPLRLS
ncbi:MAG: molybdopterin cofactor-binding domain-containing protein [Haliea sp.]|uniref:xanthine dehydrogenase family protein molybdopterin-binding subunit n=1 Tax=Haliea sp. TaxID=1932666 RepID=UPI0032EB3809